jgi:acetoin:2,6-dichlorophenolindophenol oxidoreductase subunit beta
MNGGACSVPLVIWAIINRGGEQAAQHSQALHAIFSHIPGLKVVMPSTAYDAKGLMIAAIKDDNPVVFIDDRWLYDLKGEVPVSSYEVKIGKGALRRKGKDVTIAAISYMANEAIKAGIELQKDNIDAEIIDLRTAKPLDCDIILKSVKKTGRLVVCDPGWKSFGLSAEVVALVAENLKSRLKSGIVRIALPDVPAPASCILEKAYYPDYRKIIEKVKIMFNQRRGNGKF